MHVLSGHGHGAVVVNVMHAHDIVSNLRETPQFQLAPVAISENHLKNVAMRTVRCRVDHFSTERPRIQRGEQTSRLSQDVHQFDSAL